MKPTLLILCLVVACGCEPQLTAYQLPAPPLDVPTCNLPRELRQTNWLGPLKQGSCVYASLTSHAQWLNMPELAKRIRAERGDGEYETRLMKYLDSMKLEYSATVKGDPRFLDWCDAERRGCILWWKPSHCCTFMGWVIHGGKQYGVILDNNRVDEFELVEREQLVRLWSGYGGFALCLLYDPAPSVPFKSYELR